MIHFVICSHDPNDGSPFVVRNKPKKKRKSEFSSNSCFSTPPENFTCSNHNYIYSSKKAWRPAKVDSPNPGPEEDSGSSDDDSDIEDGDFMSQPSAPKAASLLSSSSAPPELLSTMESYGFELKDPSREDQLLYER